jgi:hypothetical protein
MMIKESDYFRYVIATLLLCLVPSIGLAGQTPLSEYRLKIISGNICYKRQKQKTSNCLNSLSTIPNKESGGIIDFASKDAKIEVICLISKGFLGFRERLDEPLILEGKKIPIKESLSNYCLSTNNRPVEPGNDLSDCRKSFDDLRLGTSNTPILLSPRYSLVVNPNPKIVWVAVNGARNYEIYLYAANSSTGEDHVIWKKEVRAIDLQKSNVFSVNALEYINSSKSNAFPELERGKSYRFEIVVNQTNESSSRSSQEEVNIWSERSKKNQRFQECFKAQNGISGLRFSYEPDEQIRKKLTQVNQLNTTIDSILSLSENLAVYGLHSEAIALYQRHLDRSVLDPDQYVHLAWLYNKVNLLVPECISYRDMYYYSLGNTKYDLHRELAEKNLRDFLGNDWHIQVEGGVCKPVSSEADLIKKAKNLINRRLPSDEIS